MTQPDIETKSVMLTVAERWLLGLLGAALLVVGLLLAAPTRLARDSWTIGAGGTRERTDHSSEDVVRTTECLAAFAGGLLLLLVSLNGRRITRIKVRDMEVNSEAREAGKSLSKSIQPQLAKEVVPEEAPADVLPVGSAISTESVGRGDELGIYSWKDVPARVMSDTIANWPQDAGAKPANLAEFVVAVRRLGQGNHPWFLEFRNRRPVKVSYGGQAKGVATVSAV